jgi:hypothetical protein
MTERHQGRLEGLLLSVVVIAASGLAVGGVWRISELAEEAQSSACEQVAMVQRDSLAQVMTLALALVALRRLMAGGPNPPA